MPYVLSCLRSKSSDTRVATIHHQRSFSLQQMETITETHNWTSNCRELMPVDTSPSLFLHLRETPWKTEWKGCKVQDSGKSAVTQSLRLHKQDRNTGKTNGHVNIEGRKFHHVSPPRQKQTNKQKTTGNQWLLGELSSPRVVSPYWLSNEEWSVLKSYVHHRQKQTQQVVFIHICIHTHNSNNKRKKAINSRGHEKGWRNGV